MKDLFGNEVKRVPFKTKRIQTKCLFDDYDSFVKKFEIKKTTDDCHTPKEIYDGIKNYVVDKFSLQNNEIIRPFYPGLDYENTFYPENCVVIDNPPFSIISQIVKFYTKNDIKFFLFAPHLTLFDVFSKSNITYVVPNTYIIYENGANVKTSFVSNLYENDLKIVVDAKIYRIIEEINKKTKIKIPKYKYHNNVITVSRLANLAIKGVSFEFKINDIQGVDTLDSQKKYRKSIFGRGFFISELKAAELKAAELKAADDIIEWELSEREKEIIKKLGNNDN